MTNKLSKNFQQPAVAFLPPDTREVYEELKERAFARHSKEHGIKFLAPRCFKWVA